ncbi:hypothetical protein Pan258_03020 [Symmachiella dynata]|uniref:hypothetical protein n=1 Tax=Symmachiella dynata TaxID=2527995 RepID=UPI00118CB937|nr:hypothetical protein [Symmachiella dynata]QDT46284.1 hypothetical protein Pan258_03020 [Symmachiella dynata]
METQQIKTVTWLAVAIGTAMIAVACFVYITQREFGLGGAALTLLGVVLVGSSIWKNIDISIGKEGAITAKLVRRLENVEANVEGVQNEIRELETIVISENSALADVSMEQLQRLRLREKSNQARAAGDFKGALEIDPLDVMSMIGLIEKETKRKNYAEAIRNAEALRAADKSGVCFTAYPDLILSYDQTHAAPQAASLVAELDRKISRDISKGYGYLSRAEQLKWINRDLKRIQEKLSDQSVAAAVRALVHCIEATVTDLVS